MDSYLQKVCIVASKHFMRHIRRAGKYLDKRANAIALDYQISNQFRLHKRVTKTFHEKGCLVSLT